MKLKKKTKGVGDIKGNGPLSLTQAQYRSLPFEAREAWAKMQERYSTEQDNRKRAGESPLEAAKVGMSYYGPAMPDKGKKGGSCNRSACQLPLANSSNFSMRGDSTVSRLYYCDKCARMFNEDNRVHNEPPRCTIVEEDRVGVS